jgi:hypothetical protein
MRGPLALCVALVACDSDAPKQQLEAPKPVKAEAPAQAPAVRDDPKPAPIEPVPAKDFVGMLAAKPEPSLVGPFEGLELSPFLTVPQAELRAPHLFRTTRPDEIAGDFLFSSPAYPGIAFEVDRMGQIDSGPETWLVDVLRAKLPDDTAAAKLTAAWGEPSTAGDTKIWLAPALHLRADLEGRTLSFRRYMPLTEFIGVDRDRFGFEGGAPILGATGADLQRRFGRRIFDYSRILLDPLERGRHVLLEFAWPLALGEDDLPTYVVPGYALELDAPSEEVHALLAARLGKPTPDPKDASILVYKKRPRITYDGVELVVGTPPD